MKQDLLESAANVRAAARQLRHALVGAGAIGGALSAVYDPLVDPGVPASLAPLVSRLDRRDDA